ncbi:MAG: OmpH family outer membrane protein [Bacteroidetes bacterium]|nr:OmpH family outer membrane protein [Bacteroidota bacterium]
MNNRISLLLNVVLLAAVAVLFYLHFKGNASGTESPVSVKKDSVSPKLMFDVPKNLAGARVLYVNIDSINLRYDAITDLTRETEAYMKSLDQRYQKRQMEVQEQYSKYQQRAQAQTISASEAEAEEKSINAGMEELAKMERELSQLQNNAFKKNEKIVTEVSSYFKEYSKTKGIDFILGYGSASNVLYANDSLDVTADVLNALNATYRQTKGGKK